MHRYADKLGAVEFKSKYGVVNLKMTLVRHDSNQVWGSGSSIDQRLHGTALLDYLVNRVLTKNEGPHPKKLYENPQIVIG